MIPGRIGTFRFADASIKFKLLTLVFAALAFPFALAVLLIRSNSDAMESFSREVDAYATVNQLKFANRQNLDLLGVFLESGSMGDLNRYNEGVDGLVRALKLLESGEDTDVAFLLHSIGNSFGSLYDEAHTAIRRRIAGGEFYSPYYRAERIGRYLDSYISQLMDRTLVVGTEKYRLRAERARIARNVSILTLALFAVLCIGLGSVFADLLTKPLRRLAAAAKRIAASDLDLEALPVESADEVGALTGSFNRMSAHIAALVRDLTEKAALEERLHQEELRNSASEQMRKEAEFLALQARINPHFLFNTLNSISRDVMLRGGRDAIALVDSLSALLRYGLEQGAGIVSLGTELEIVRKYAFIQGYRYEKRIDIRIDCSLPDPESVRLPAFSVQPLVENSLIHGVEPKVEGGTISVEAFARGASVVIRVADDGIGLDAARLRAIRASRELESGGHTSSIGLSNVRERLRFFTGDRHCFVIKNAEGGGTLAEIVLKGALR